MAQGGGWIPAFAGMTDGWLGGESGEGGFDFAAGGWVGLGGEGALEGGAGFVAADSTQGPGGVAADEGLVFVKGAGEGGNCGGVGGVAEGDAGVAFESNELGALEGAVGEAAAEFFVGHFEHLDKLEGGESLLLEGLLAGVEGVDVDGANVLADVASEYPVGHEGADFEGDVAAVFDGLVGDAAFVVDDVGGGEGAGGAGLEAEGAGAAVFLEGRVGLQFQVGYDLAEEDPGAVG